MWSENSEEISKYHLIDLWVDSRIIELGRAMLKK